MSAYIASPTGDGKKGGARNRERNVKILVIRKLKAIEGIHAASTDGTCTMP
jgi:hypothetical protein